MLSPALILLLLAPMADPAPVAEGLDDILARWEKKSSEIRTIQASFTREDVSPLFETKRKYQGWYVYRDEKAARLDFAESVDGRPQFDERFMVVGDEAYQYQKSSKHLFIFPRPDPAKFDHAPAAHTKRGFLETLQQAFLENHFMWFFNEMSQPESPFLFLKFRSEAARARYRIEILPPRHGKHILKFTPREQRDAYEFSQVLLSLDATTFLPDTLRVTSPNGKDTKTFRYTKIEINADIPADKFTIEQPPTWNVIRWPVPKGEAGAAAPAR